MTSSYYSRYNNRGNGGTSFPLSDFRSSGPRVNGDDREEVCEHYVSLSSSTRDKHTFSSSNDCELNFDEIQNVIGLSLTNFEIPHTRYAIDESNNTLYLSEKIGESLYNFFGLKVGTGGYTVGNLAVSLELSQNSVTTFMPASVLQNKYTFSTSSSFGKIAIVSSGDVEYNIHVCKEELDLVSFTKISDGEALVQFIAPFEYIVAPGALLTLKVYNEVDREVQVVQTNAPRTVTLIGDFSSASFDSLDVQLRNDNNNDSTTTTTSISSSKSFMIPYSSYNSVAEVAGFGNVDLQNDKNTTFPTMAVQSPFAMSLSDGYLNPMILVQYPLFVSPGEYVRVSGDDSGMLSGVTFQVGTTHDDTHFNISVDPTLLFQGTDIKVWFGDNQTSSADVTDISVTAVDRNVVTILVRTGDTTTSIEQGDLISFTGFTTKEWTLQTIPVTVVSVVDDSSNTAFVATFTYYNPCSNNEGQNTFVTPVSAETGIPTTYLTPQRFDLSRGRRVMLCRASVDGKDLGSIHIPNDRTIFFGRVQLFSGADLVNFLSSHQAIGHHRFKSIVKRLRSIRFRFYNEDGTDYDFIGVDYTVFLKVLTLDSNTGI